jgi:hypothetical protein
MPRGGPQRTPRVRGPSSAFVLPTADEIGGVPHPLDGFTPARLRVDHVESRPVALAAPAVDDEVAFRLGWVRPERVGGRVQVVVARSAKQGVRAGSEVVSEAVTGPIATSEDIVAAPA